MFVYPVQRCLAFQWGVTCFFLNATREQEAELRGLCDTNRCGFKRNCRVLPTGTCSPAKCFHSYLLIGAGLANKSALVSKGTCGMKQSVFPKGKKKRKRKPSDWPRITLKYWVTLQAKGQAACEQQFYNQGPKSDSRLKWCTASYWGILNPGCSYTSLNLAQYARKPVF